MWPIYDWAKDDRALVYNPPQQKYLCPNGHKSEATLDGKFVYCYNCSPSMVYDVVKCGRILE